MTGLANGGTERGTRAPSRLTGRQGAVGALFVVLVVGLLLRLILARLLPGSGFEVDLNAFRFWASNLADEGLGGFYARDFFHDYTPGYLYVLWLVGIVGNAVGGVGDLIKIPPVLSDLAVGYLAWSMVRELGGRDRLALAAAAVAVLNPITWFDSVVWGQVDSFGVVFVMLGLRELWRDRPERAAIYTVVAAIIKPQLGILIPLVAVVTIRRALFPAGGYGDPERTGRPIRILTTGLAGLPDRGRAVPAVRSVGHLVQQRATVRHVRPARAGRRRGRRLPVPDGQRLQPVGARTRGSGPEPGERGAVGVRLRGHSLRLRIRGRGLRRGPGGPHRVGPVARRHRADPGRRRPAPRPIDAAGRPGGPGSGLLRRAHPRPRALRLPVLRAGRHPRRDLVPVAARVPRPVGRDLRQHVRRPDDALPGQPVRGGLAGRRTGDPICRSGCRCSRSCTRSPSCGPSYS